MISCCSHSVHMQLETQTTEKCRNVQRLGEHPQRERCPVSAIPLVSEARLLSPKVRLLSCSRGASGLAIVFLLDARALNVELSVTSLYPGLSSSKTLERRLLRSACLTGVYRLVSAAGAGAGASCAPSRLCA